MWLRHPSIREPKFRLELRFPEKEVDQPAHARHLGEELFGEQPKGRVMQLQMPWFKPAAWGVVLGAIGTMIVGFSWLGWTLGSTADRFGLVTPRARKVPALM